MVFKTFVPEDAAERWRVTVDRLLAVGMEAGRASRDDAAPLASDDPLAQELDDAIALFTSETEELLSVDGTGPASPQSITLLGGLQTVDALLRASDVREFEGMFSDGQLDLDAWNATLDEYVWAMTGHVPVPGLSAEDLGSTLDALQKSGADELIALAQNKAMWGALAGFGSGMVAFGGAVAVKALEAVSEALNPFRRRVLELLQWIVKRLRKLMPEPFMQLVDEQLGWLQETVAEQVPSRIAGVLGQVLGRVETEAAWGEAASRGEDVARAEAALGKAVAGHIERIGYVGSGRKKMDSIAAMLTRWVVLAVPQVQVVVGASALTVFAFVLYQVRDGFTTVEGLVAEENM